MEQHWELWAGAETSPVDPTDRVYLRYRDGIESKVRIAGDLRWAHNDLPDDIMMWRFSHHQGE
jgi:hypothetical protein